MSEDFHRKCLMRHKQLKAGLIPIRAPAKFIPEHFPVLGRVNDLDIQHTYTILDMTIDECEHLTTIVHEMEQRSGKGPVSKKIRLQALRLSLEVETLATELDWKLRLYFSLVSQEENPSFVFLYSSWVASLYGPGYQLPDHFVAQAGHA